MAASNQQYLAGEVALWMQRTCGDALTFLGCHTLSGVVVPRGESNPLYCREGKNNFVVQRTFKGAPGLGQATVTAYDTILNELQEIGCAVNLYALHSASGADEDPTNYDYLYIYEGFEVSSEDTDPHSVGIAPDAQTSVMISMPSTFQKRIKVKDLTAQSVSLSSLSTNDFNAISFCDQASCDSFGKLLTVGCQVGFIATDGTTAQILKTTNGGSTWTAIASPFTNADDNIIDVFCSDNVVIALNGTNTAYAYSWDTGTTWTEVTSPTQLMNKGTILGGTKVWIVAQGGYIYYSSNRGATVSTQTAGDVTTQSLNDISASDALLLYAVGDNNTFLRTVDGGAIWSLVTGPAAAVYPNDLYVVKAIAGTDIVLVADEQGNLYRSEDNGDTWSTVMSNSNLAGGIRGIAACNCNVLGVIGNDTDPYFYGSATGYMYQSVDGGNSWQSVEVPTNTGLLDIVCCDVNRYWISGVGGFAAKVAGPTV